MKKLYGDQSQKRLVQRIFESDEFARIRTVTDMPEDPFQEPIIYFVAKDVCDALDYSNHRATLKRHLEPEDMTCQMVPDRHNCGRKTLVINESGLFALIMASQQEKARRFRHYVTSVILPSIIHAGAYIDPPMLAQLKADPTGVEVLVRNLEQSFRRADVLKAHLNHTEAALAQSQKECQGLMVQAAFGQSVLASENSISVSAMAKLIFKQQGNIGAKRFFEWLRANGYLCCRACYRNHPTQRALELGVLELVEVVWQGKRGNFRNYQKPMVTPKGQAYFLELLGRQKQMQSGVQQSFLDVR